MSRFRFMITTTLLVTSLSLAACNTVRGAGEDIQKAGQAIQKSAN